MPKRTKYKSLNYIPTSYNFSDVYKEDENFDVDDMGKEVEELYDKFAFEQLIVDVLYHLDDREKLIFMFQILRDAGYNIDHKSCSIVLNMGRVWYMENLSKVKQKVSFILKQKRTKREIKSYT
jgi:hypothetical protein